MKKFITFLTLMTLLVALTACGCTADDHSTNPPVENTGNAGTSGTISNDSSSNSNISQNQVSITETVLVDEAGVKITAKGISVDDDLNTELKLYIENNSGKNLTFQCNNSSINDYMVDTIMSVDVVDGKRANDSLAFLTSDIHRSGIEAIAELEFSFHIFTTDDWETYLNTPQIEIETSIADNYEDSFDESGTIAYKGDEIEIIIKGLSENTSLLGPGIVVYIENDSDQDITVQTRDVSINGFMVDAIFSEEILSDKQSVDTITFLSTDLEENSITNIESVELSFHIFDSASWNTIVDTDVVTMTF